MLCQGWPWQPVAKTHVAAVSKVRLVFTNIGRRSVYIHDCRMCALFREVERHGLTTFSCGVGRNLGRKATQG